jgi:hypothetical protein
MVNQQLTEAAKHTALKNGADLAFVRLQHTCD